MSNRHFWCIVLLVGLYASPLLSQDDHDDHQHEQVVDAHNHTEHEEDHAKHADHEPLEDKHDRDQHDESHDGHDEEGHGYVEHEDHDEHDGHGKHEGHDEHGEEHTDEVHLRPEQIKTLALKTQLLEYRELSDMLQAPGEVRLNQYATERVSPRVSAQVVSRNVQLGEVVKANQLLVTLTSVQMSEAQGEVVVAVREWQRVRKLGRKVVSESRYLEAQIKSQQARAKALAYGMTPDQITTLLKSGASKADGTFQLLAPRSGTVVSDDFVIGEIIEPGRALFEITDESVRWVEAGFASTEASRISMGDDARIRVGDKWLAGHVMQVQHLIDEKTRTRAVRIEVPDPGHRLHPGEFVEVFIESGKGRPVLALPEAAVLRSPDGDWQVFVTADEPGAFRPVEVTRKYTTGGLAIIEGVQPGTDVVTLGAFFLASELAKGGFDPHNH